MGSLIKMSEAVSIAVHACAWLAAVPGRSGRPADICPAFGFSAAHFAKVMQALSRAGIVVTTRGRAGGTRLARDARSITLLQIYEAVDGPVAGNRCLLSERHCASRCCTLGQAISAHHEGLRRELDRTTLAQLAASLTKRTEQDRS